jgi:hypothetical protein
MVRIIRDLAVNVIAGSAVGLVLAYTTSIKIGLWVGLAVGVVGLCSLLLWERHHGRASTPSTEAGSKGIVIGPEASDTHTNRNVIEDMDTAIEDHGRGSTHEKNIIRKRRKEKGSNR